MGKTPQVIGQAGHIEYCHIENFEFFSEPSYILYLPAVTKLRILDNSGSDSDSGVWEGICCDWGSASV